MELQYEKLSRPITDRRVKSCIFCIKCAVCNIWLIHGSIHG